MTPKMKKRIKDIPSDGEWYKESSFVGFISAGELMLDSGMSENETIGILETLYSAVSDEYGN